MNKLSVVQAVLAVVVGFALLAGAAALWHWFDMNPFLAILLGISGLTAIGHGLGVNLN